MTGFQATCAVCGRTTTSKTQPLADYGIRRHSCAKQQSKTQRAAEHAARMATVDRTPKPCHHKQADHQHGTYAAYVLDRCRCTACSKANGDYERDRTRQHAYGRFDQRFVDGDTVRAHIETLQASGLGWKRIARIAGVAHGTMWKIIYGVPSAGRPPSRRVRHATADKILAVTPDPHHLAGGARVDATGTRRRLQALVAIGWSLNRIAELLGWQTSNLHKIHTSRQVIASTARAVHDLYEQLWDQAPPATNRWQAAGITRAKNLARNHGWLPPMAYDDIDDPRETPTVDPEPTPRRGGKAQKVNPDDVEFLLDQQAFTRDGLAARLRVHPGSIYEPLRRAGREDLVDRIKRNSERTAA